MEDQSAQLTQHWILLSSILKSKHYNWPNAGQLQLTGYNWFYTELASPWQSWLTGLFYSLTTLGHTFFKSKKNPGNIILMYMLALCE